MTRPPSVHLDEILPDVIEELRAIAGRALRYERANHTLQPSALINEVYMQFQRRDLIRWECRSHFFASVSDSIRKILISHARTKRAQKRGGGVAQRVELDDAVGMGNAEQIDVLDVDVALRSLAEFDKRLSRVVHLRYFGGLSIAEIAEVMGLAHRTIHADLKVAKVWLRREMKRLNRDIELRELDAQT